MKPHGGLIFYRGFVYDHHMDWRNPKNDRARAAYDRAQQLSALNEYMTTGGGPLAGRQVELTGYVQADWVAYSQESVDELDPATGKPLNEERFVIPRARLRAEARKDAFVGVVELMQVLARIDDSDFQTALSQALMCCGDTPISFATSAA